MLRHASRAQTESAHPPCRNLAQTDRLTTIRNSDSNVVYLVHASAAANLLRDTAHSFRERAYAPFSGQRVAAAFLCEDGRIIPGVRVESASFSLSLPALLNAFTTAVSIGRRHQLVGVALSRTFSPADGAYLRMLVDVPLEPAANDVWLLGGGTREVPEPTEVIDPRIVLDADVSPDDGIQYARDAALQALVPSSNFRVGTVLETPNGDFFPGANVEHPDWARILCAERNAAGTARTFGQPAAERIFLTCLDDDQGSPCGACRQVLAELTPDAVLWMDRHDEPAERTTPEALLPGFFQGRSLM